MLEILGNWKLFLIFLVFGEVPHSRVMEAFWMFGCLGGTRVEKESIDALLLKVGRFSSSSFQSFSS